MKSTPSKTTKNQEVLLPNHVVSERIKQARIRKNYTMEYMAHELGISEKGYQNIEYNINKGITIQRLQEIANILEMNWLELLKNDKKYTQINGDNSSHSNHLNLYSPEAALFQENQFLKEKITLLEKRISDLEELNAVLKTQK